MEFTNEREGEEASGWICFVIGDALLLLSRWPVVLVLVRAIDMELVLRRDSTVEDCWVTFAFDC